MQENPKKAWSTLAKQCVKKYNAKIHSVTKFEPCYLMDGTTSAIVPRELARERNLVRDRAEALLDSMKYFEENKRRIDENWKSCVISEGDYVFVENGSELNRSKLDEVRVGPFRVVRNVSNSMFELNCGEKKKEGNIFHCGKLIPFLGIPNRDRGGRCH